MRIGIKFKGKVTLDDGYLKHIPLLKVRPGFNLFLSKPDGSIHCCYNIPYSNEEEKRYAFKKIKLLKYIVSKVTVSSWNKLTEVEQISIVKTYELIFNNNIITNLKDLDRARHQMFEDFFFMKYLRSGLSLHSFFDMKENNGKVKIYQYEITIWKK